MAVALLGQEIDDVVGQQRAVRFLQEVRSALDLEMKLRPISSILGEINVDLVNIR
jgi:hypothetical protein